MPEDHDPAATPAEARPRDAFADMPPPTTSVEVRDRLVHLLRRDLVGPHPDLDPDLAREVLADATPSTWYLTGFLAPANDAPSAPIPETLATRTPAKPASQTCAKPKPWAKPPTPAATTTMPLPSHPAAPSSPHPSA